MGNLAARLIRLSSKPRILSLRARLALVSIRSACLHPKTCRKNELAHSRAETTQEGVERLLSSRVRLAQHP